MAAALAVFLLAGCGGDDDADPGEANGSEAACLAEISRQMSDPAKETDDVPPQCQGLSDAKLTELAKQVITDRMTQIPQPPR